VTTSPPNDDASAPWDSGTPAINSAGNEWLSKPENVKTLAGGIGVAVGLLIVFGGGPQGKLLGLLIMAASWAIFLRSGYHKKAGLRLQARIPSAEAAQLITDLATGTGSTSSVELTAAQAEWLDFIAHTRPNPLTFRVTLHQDASAVTSISSQLVKWTKRQSRTYLIPVPFTQRIDGYGTYKAFANHVIEALRQRDSALSGGFEDNPVD
jgi:hypothetical protein